MSSSPSNAPPAAALAVEEKRRLVARLLREKAAAQSHPLSFAQQRLWFLEQIGSGSAYNMRMAFRLQGPVDLPALERALSEIVRRHASLRTVYGAVEGEGRQYVRPARTISLEPVDLVRFPPETREAELDRLLSDLSTRPFDLAQDPLLRAHWLRLDREVHLLLLIVHHIAGDGWSLSLLQRELFTLYEAYAQGLPSPLPELPIQYLDFAVWQRKTLQGEALAAHLAYWKARLAGAPALLQLPTDRPRPDEPSYRGNTARLRIGRETTQALLGLSRSSHATLFMTLLAAFYVLLSRYSGQDDIVVGTPFANRTRRELEPLIGFFVNTLVLRADLAGNPSFLEFLAQVRETTREAYGHQDLPFERLVEELQPERNLSHNPIVQVAFALLGFGDLDAERGESTGWSLPGGLHAGAFPIDAKMTHVDLEFHLSETEGEIAGVCFYSTDLFDAGTIGRMIGHYGNLLAGIAADPARPIAELPWLDAAERHRLLVEWNATAALPADRCFHQIFERQAALHPDAPALVFEAGCMSYRELNQRANQLAHHLRGLGVGPEIQAGLCVERSPEMIIGLLGILKAGGAYVPLDPGYPGERLAFILEDAEVPVLVSMERLAACLPARAARTVCLDRDAPALAECRRSDPEPLAGPGHLVYVIYTSGSTGRPKGVLVEHRGLCNVALAGTRMFGIGPGDRVLQFCSLNFDGSAFEIVLALGSGATLCLGTRETLAPGEPLREFLERHAVTFAALTPSTLAALPAVSLPALHTLCVAGEACPGALLERWTANRRVFNLYGPTEAGIWSTAAPCPAGTAAAPPIGRPIDNVRVYVVDRFMQPVPIGVPGELCVGGVGVARGYSRQTALTAERFIDCPFDGGRLYRTGDVVRWRADGNLEFIGRTDDQVKLRGFRIEPGEIEAALLECSEIREATVLLREDPPGPPRLVAYVTVENGGQRGVAEHLEQWRSLYRDVYGQALRADRAASPFEGWNSSYTGEPIPETEMLEWVEHAVAEIRALQPRRILEIGCGSGLLLSRLAPECELYFGTDGSEEALEPIRRSQAMRDHPGRIELAQCLADDFTGIEAGAFDAVVLNSVVQYFPCVDYLLRVLDGALRSLRPGGFVYLGDVRHHGLLYAYHASVQLHRADDGLARARLRESIRQHLLDEEELTLDPALFRALPARWPRIRGVRIALERGRAHNELTRFRYLAVLQTEGGGASTAAAPLDWQDWRRNRPDAGEIFRRLAEERPEVLALADVANARLRTEGRLLRWLESGPGETVGQFRKQVPDAGIDPEELWNPPPELPYSVSITWAASGTVDAVDVVFRRRTAPGTGFDAVPATCTACRDWPSYANHPLLGKWQRALTPVLRKHLQQRLPDYMVPASFLLLDRMPLTPNGKIDRKALPAPGATAVAARFERPGTPAEAALAAIWQDVLGIGRIGIHDNFFELGGNSILAVQVINRARQADFALAVKDLFRHQTVAELAAAVASPPESGPVPAAAATVLSPAESRGSRPPIFCAPGIEGDTAYLFPLARQLAPEQPFYGLPAHGLDGLGEPCTGVELQAARHLRAIRGVQPQGPYWLAGHSFGGLIAFEIAQQLLRQGEPVAGLLLFDAWAPHLVAEVDASGWDEIRWLAELGGILTQGGEAGRARVREALTHVPAEQRLPRFKEWLETEQVLPANSEPRRLQGMMRIFQANMRAAYRPEDPRKLPIGLFLAEGASPQTAEMDRQDPTRGWRRHALGEIDLVRVPGHHSTLLSAPHTAGLARALAACQARLLARYRTGQPSRPS